MHRILLIGLAVFLSTALSGQSVFQEEKVGWKGNNIELHTVHDKTGKQHALFLVSDDSIRVILTGSQDNIIREFSISRMNEEKVLGAFINQQKIFLFCAYRQPHGFHNYVLDIGNGTISQALVADDPGKEKMIDRLSAGDHFLYFVINRKTSEFIIYDWHNQEDADTIRYQFTDKEVWTNLSVSRGFGREVNIAKVDEEGEPDIEAAGNQNKVYFLHDTLFLVMNHDDGLTKIFSFDCQRKQTAFREISYPPAGRKFMTTNTGHGSQYEQPYDYSDNSFLKDGRLYFVSATTENLNILVADFYSGRVLQKFSVTSADSIPFKNTPIIQEGMAYAPNGTKELGKTRQLLRKMVNGNAVIGAMNDSAGIALMIGSYMHVEVNNGGSYMPVGGTSGAMTYVPAGGFSRSSWTKSVHFRMLLDSNTLNHIPGEMQPGITERIEHYTENIKIPDGAENLYRSQGRYIYVYYDKKQRSLVFTRI